MFFFDKILLINIISSFDILNIYIYILIRIICFYFSYHNICYILAIFLRYFLKLGTAKRTCFYL